MAKSKKYPPRVKLSNFDKILSRLEQPFTYELSFEYTKNSAEEQYSYESISNVKLNGLYLPRFINSFDVDFSNITTHLCEG